MGAFTDITILHLSTRKGTTEFIRHVYTGIGIRVVSTDSSCRLSDLAAAEHPDLVIMDAYLPGGDCYELCAELQSHAVTSSIPIVIVTDAPENHYNAPRAFVSGIVDFLEEPLETAPLIDLARRHAETARRWRGLEDGCVMSNKLQICMSAMHGTAVTDRWSQSESFLSQVMPRKYVAFKELLVTGEGIGPEAAERLLSSPPFQLYDAAARSGISRPQLARQIAEFIGTKYIRYITSELILSGILPPQFCKANMVLPLRMSAGRYSIVLSNPFEWELIAYLHDLKVLLPDTQVFITKPENILHFFECHDSGPVRDAYEYIGEGESDGDEPEVQQEQIPLLEKGPAAELAEHILTAAVIRRASDIHIEPKTAGFLVRFRIDGDLHDFTFLKEAGNKIISRFKVKAGMDIGECRRPQDGAVSLLIRNVHYNLRLATSSTPNGESMIIRLLNTNARVKDIMGLGMSERQSRLIKDLTGRKAGLILTVGPAGSGKTTTVYSILSHIDCLSRSLLSVEDPIEYTIPFATQQQVNEKAGLTYEALLKASVRQDPNVLFIGEVRDQASAKIALDFTSTGHLTISTMHTSNATTAIFRLERLGIARSVMAENVLAIIAQRLLKCLCPFCKQIEPITDEEKDMLTAFVADFPARVGHPVGCGRCNHTGYLGRTGLFEVVYFDRQVVGMIRDNVPISDIRKMLRDRGDFLIFTHAMEKIREFSCSVSEIYAGLLVEEVEPAALTRHRPGRFTTLDRAPEKHWQSAGILLVADDSEQSLLLLSALEARGCLVEHAASAHGAMVNISSKPYRLIIAEQGMKDLDGLKLLELIHQKALDLPVIFLTTGPDDEERVMSFGVAGVDVSRQPVDLTDLLVKMRKLEELHGADALR